MNWYLHRKAKRWGEIPKKKDIGSVLDSICVDIMRYILNIVFTENCDFGEERERKACVCIRGASAD